MQRASKVSACRRELNSHEEAAPAAARTADCKVEDPTGTASTQDVMATVSEADLKVSLSGIRRASDCGIHKRITRRLRKRP